MIWYSLFLSFLLSHFLPFITFAHSILLERCAFTELDCIDSTNSKPDLEKTFKPCIYTTLGTEGGDHPNHASLKFISNETVAVALVGSKLYFKDQDTFWGLLNSLMPSCPEKTALEYSRDDDVAMAPSTLFELIDAECAVTNLCQIYEDLNGVQPNATYYANTTYQLSYDKFNSDYPYSFWMVFLPVDQTLVVNGSSANVMIEFEFMNNPVVYGKSMSKHVFWILIVVVAGYFAIFNALVINKLVDWASRISCLRRFLQPRTIRTVSKSSSSRQDSSSRARSEFGFRSLSLSGSPEQGTSSLLEHSWDSASYNSQ